MSPGLPNGLGMPIRTDVPESPQPSETTRTPRKSGFRSIPGILTRRSGAGKSLTSADRITLAVLVQSAREGITQISNKEIAKRAGLLHKHPQEIHRRLRRLESLGLILRFGAHKARKICILFPSPPNDKPLLIPEDILDNPSLTSTQKLVLAAQNQFHHLSPGSSWYANRIGVSKWTWWYNKQRLQPYNFSNGNPITFQTQPYNFSNSYLEEIRREPEKRSLKTPQICAKRNDSRQTNQSPPEEPTMESSTPKRKAYTTPHPDTFRNNFRKIYHTVKPPPKVRQAPAWACQELSKWLRDFPHLTKQYHPDKKNFHTAARVLVKLSKSLDKTLPDDLKRSIRRTMRDRNFTDRQIDLFFSTQFKVAERFKLLKDLARSHSPEYNPRANGKRRACLIEALCSYKLHYCLLLQVYFNPPRIVQAHVPRPTDEEVERAVEHAQELCQDWSAETKASLVRLINSLRRDYRNIWSKELLGTDLEWEFGTFSLWWDGLVHSISGLISQFGRATPSWFGVHTRPVQGWVRELRRRLRYDTPPQSQERFRRDQMSL